MGDRPKDEVNRLSAELRKLKEENKQLSAERDEAVAKLSEAMKAFIGPEKVRRERDRLAAEVEELRKFKDKAEPRLAKVSQVIAEHDQIQIKFRQISTDTEGLTSRLDHIVTAFRGSDNRHPARRAIEAVMATITFLTRHGVESRLLAPLKDLYSALSDAERGISNPTTAPDESKRRSKGAPMRASESNHWGSASWAVTGLIRLGDTKKKALDIAAEAAGLPRDELMKFRQGLIAPKRRGPIGAQYVYDYLDEDVARDSRFELKIIVERLLSRLRETRDIGLI